jgi:tryptophanyl-tRNA synthetase
LADGEARGAGIDSIEWAHDFQSCLTHATSWLVAAASHAAPLIFVPGPLSSGPRCWRRRALETVLVPKGFDMTNLEPAVTSNSNGFAPTVLTGDRPTGQLHLGHLIGTLQNRVRLQRDGVELMVLVADYQTITDRDSPASLPEDVEELVADYLAVGIDATRATIFAHSLVPELNQLLLPFLSLVTLPELRRNPTVKDEAAGSGMPTLNGLMLTYPVHRAADILFCQATIVPVGADQLPHVEQTRAIARRFNRRYAPEHPVFPEPEALLSDAPVLLGIDGRKMSKSRNNAITLAASSDETARLLRQARTDSDPNITYEPKTRPEVANLVLLTACARTSAPPRSPRRSAVEGPPNSSA